MKIFPNKYDNHVSALHKLVVVIAGILIAGTLLGMLAILFVNVTDIPLNTRKLLAFLVLGGAPAGLILVSIVNYSVGRRCRRFGFDNTQREVFAREIDLKKSRFQISRRALVRVALGSSALFLGAGLAYYFEQYYPMWLAIFAGAFIAAWQLLFYGYGSKPEDESALKVTNSYSKGVLIFLAVFWTALIVGVAIAMYLKLPSP